MLNKMKLPNHNLPINNALVAHTSWKTPKEPENDNQLLFFHEAKFRLGWYDGADNSSVEALAVQKDLKIVHPQHNELQIDIDNEDQYNSFRHVWPMFKAIAYNVLDRQTVRYKMKPSKSNDGKGENKYRYHITVPLAGDIYDDMERIALQAILQSDPIRELLNFSRHKNNNKPNILFLEKEDG